MGQRRCDFRFPALFVGFIWLTRALGINIKGLFGDYCTGDVFHYDEHMAQLGPVLNVKNLGYDDTQTSVEPTVEEETLALDIQCHPEREETPASADNLNSSQGTITSTSSTDREVPGGSQGHESAGHEAATSTESVIGLTFGDSDDAQEPVAQRRLAPDKRTLREFLEQKSSVFENMLLGDSISESDSFHSTAHLLESQESFVSATALEARRMAFNAMMDASNLSGWPGLISTTNNHTRPESELGEG